MIDPELLRLLVEELERHLAPLERWSGDPQQAQRSLHALKGSSGLAGERELGSALDRLERRTREGDDRAFEEAVAVVRSAIVRLAAGDTAVSTSWPEPPEDLVARPLDPLVRAQYAAEVTDRLGRIDDALSTREDPVEAVHILYRHVHTMKGAASAAGDEPMTWFCHGLEEKLRDAADPQAAGAAMMVVARWRVVLGALLEQPETALAMLASGASAPGPSDGETAFAESNAQLLATFGPRPQSSHPARMSGGGRSDSDSPPRPLGFDEATATIRVPAADVDRLVERLEVIDRARERVAARADRAGESAAALRTVRSSLRGALRLIGPPRPWGAPAAAVSDLERAASATGKIVEDLDGASSRLRATELLLREGVAEAKKQLSTMRQTTAGRLFARLTTAIESEARRSGRSVIVRTRGADETLDRRLAEQLLEPCLQLVRNAVAHGIERPEVRAAHGKPESGTISMAARKLGSRLRVMIADAGAGVDLAGVRGRAAAAGLISLGVAEAADDDTLLSLLFLPGFSTRGSSDLLAGRGIGLDITRACIQRLGGVIRLSSRPGEGVTARVEVPIESGFVNVLWVTAGGDEFALPAAHAERVRKIDPHDRAVPHLLACFGLASPLPRYAIDLDLQAEDRPESVSVGVDGIGHTDELLIRPLAPLLAGIGPFAGAIMRGDGSLRLALDAWAIAPRVQAMTASSAPSRSPAPQDRPR